MYPDLPYSQACENNKAPILAILQQAFAECSAILEIGSGTGQHAAHFAKNLPHLTWQASDQQHYLPELNERLKRAALPNLPQAFSFDVTKQLMLPNRFDGLFTANTLHIMSWPIVESMFQRLDELLTEKATLCIYGPFNYAGHFTSASNQLFDQSLKSRDPAMGIRDIEQVVALAKMHAFQLHEDFTMPANNRLLWFKR
ncbi:DUF938 domain-containing protein [Alishewanella sp. d11]|uniref:DUF938 domain-containing protein n=1 Tax=Alishewanella sp. d11 TaxID=3414030 RepID=UPI003BF92668